MIVWSRDDGDREVNHHGTLLPADDKKDASEKTELFKPSKKKMDLISRNEKTQVEVMSVINIEHNKTEASFRLFAKGTRMPWSRRKTS